MRMNSFKPLSSVIRTYLRNCHLPTATSSSPSCSTYKPLPALKPSVMWILLMYVVDTFIHGTSNAQQPDYFNLTAVPVTVILRVYPPVLTWTPTIASAPSFSAFSTIFLTALFFALLSVVHFSLLPSTIPNTLTISLPRHGFGRGRDDFFRHSPSPPSLLPQLDGN